MGALPGSVLRDARGWAGLTPRVTRGTMLSHGQAGVPLWGNREASPARQSSPVSHPRPTSALPPRHRGEVTARLAVLLMASHYSDLAAPSLQERFSTSLITKPRIWKAMGEVVEISSEASTPEMV